MKHHILPKCYLNGFTDPDVEPGREPHVYIATPTATDWRRRSPKNVAAKTEYYSFENEAGERDLTVEEMLSLVESSFARRMREFIEPRRDLDDDAKIELALFMAMMFVRVPAVHENLARFEVDHATKILQMEHAIFKKDPSAFTAFKKRHLEENGLDLESLSPDDFDPKNYELSVDHGGTVTMAFSIVTDISPIICAMNWRFFIAKPPDYFITSDYPLALINPKVRHPGLAQEHVELSLPLSRSVALFATWNAEPRRTWFDANTRQVRAMNLRTATYARDLYVGPKPDFPGEPEVRAKLAHRARRTVSAQAGPWE